jgi:hypothetical protein
VFSRIFSSGNGGLWGVNFNALFINPFTNQILKVSLFGGKGWILS